jgi:hypothetical protein
MRVRDEVEDLDKVVEVSDRQMGASKSDKG